jgi:hypothetical protein
MRVIPVITVTLWSAQGDGRNPAIKILQNQHRWGQLGNYLGGKKTIMLNPHLHYLTKYIPDGLRS